MCHDENRNALIPVRSCELEIDQSTLFLWKKRTLSRFLVVCISMAPFIIRQANSESEENRNDAVFSVCAVFLVLSSTGLAARMGSKRMKRSQFLIDDLLIIWAFVSR